MSTVFEEIKVEKVSDKISEQIVKLIVDGKLNPGDKLPGERQLIDVLGVGRSSLREALNRLETLGYIEIRKRKGNYVKSIDATLQLDPLKGLIQADLRKIVQLYELRRDLEQASAYNAALKRTTEDLKKIKETLIAFRRQSGAARFSWSADQDFHLAIAQASQNFLRVHVISNIFEFSEEFLAPVIEEVANQRDNQSIIAQQHEAIYQAIADQNAELAGKRMDEHLCWTNERLIELIDKNQGI
ncbi:MAG: FadR family transcriptional regulator [Deltaproteobacteria bacterium]|nr:FadR family transcriptional regulator [Deltaproteobacteria bacterium]